MNETKPASQMLVAGGAPQSIVPKTFEDVYRLARVFAATALVPKDYQNSPEACCVAIMAGLDLGLTPMAALQSIAVINGRPSLWGDAMLGVVRASGQLEYIKEETEGTVARCTVKRKGDADPVTRTFSDEDARAAGLLDKTGPWKQYRPRMRQMRARSWCLRDVFPDVLRGIASADELQDVQPMKDVTPAPARATAIMDELPDIPDGTDDTASAETGHPQTDAEFLAGFRDTVEKHHRDPGMLDLMRSDWRDAIAERGLEQQCEDIIADITGASAIEPDTQADEPPVSDPVSTPETLDMPWETATDEPVKEPVVEDGVYKKLSAYQAQMSKAPNETRAKDIQRSWAAYIDGLGARDKAQFQSVYAQTISRVRAIKEAVR